MSVTFDDPLLCGLNREQAAAVTSPGRPLVIIAGAGSGKTRVLTRRIAYRIATGEAEARHTLAITFTKRAASELKSRLRAIDLREPIEAYTFHAAALRILQRYWGYRDVAGFEILDSKYRLVTQALSSVGATTKMPGTRKKRTEENLPAQVNQSLVPALITEIEWAKARSLRPEDYPEKVIAQGRRTPLTPSEVAEVFSRYEEIKKRNRKLDLDDLIIYAARILTTDTEFAATERYRARHIYVDEFQDVNNSQMSLVEALLGTSTDLCVVGDPNQAIYSWNGADPTLIASIPERHRDAELVELKQNYRSTPQVLSLARSTFKLQPSAAALQSGLVANLGDGPLPVVRSFADDRAEAQSVARLAKRSRHPGDQWTDIAVLTRTNLQLVAMQRAFKDEGIPAFLAGETGYLSRLEIRTVLHNLERWASNLYGPTLISWIEETVEETLAANPNDQRTQDSLELFLGLSREYLSSSPGADGQSLMMWMKTEAENALEESRGNAVALTTFHKAKGLEWKTVFLCGLEEGYVPISRAETRSELDEEARLLYVAITRAKRNIFMTWAKQRNHNGRMLRREPSRYLPALKEEIDRLAGRIATKEHALETISRVRRDLGETHDSDISQSQQSLVEALRLWRDQRSKELGVSSSLIFHDHALFTMVKLLPATQEELARVAGIGPIKASRFGTDLLRILRS